MIRQCYFHWLTFCLSMLLAAASPVRADEGVEFSAMRPTKGPYVKTDRGYMVPYRKTIPGTKSHAKYWDADVDELKNVVAEYSSNGHSYKGIVDHIEVTSSAERNEVTLNGLH